MAEFLEGYSGKNIVFCLPGEYYSGVFLQNIVGLTGCLNYYGINTYVAQNSGSCIHRLRDACGGGNTNNGVLQTPFSTQGIDYDYIMWVDSDVVFNRDNFERLLRADKDLVSGWYMDKDEEPAVGFINKTPSKFFIKKPPVPIYEKNYIFGFKKDFDILSKKELYRADWVGMGWMLIKKGVMEKIGYPWFSPLTVRIAQEEDKHFYTSLSEDVSFQMKLKDAKVDLWIDPLVRVGHEKIRVL